MNDLKELAFRVLCYKEDGDWVALALEFDLIGHGDNPENAISSLASVVATQIEFARENHSSRLLFFNAEKQYFKRWRAAQNNKDENA